MLIMAPGFCAQWDFPYIICYQKLNAEKNHQNLVEDAWEINTMKPGSSQCNVHMPPFNAANEWNTRLIDVCRVDNSRLSAWRQGGWLAPCNTFHYTAAESAIGHCRGQSWVSTARHIHFPGDMSRWTEMGECGCAWDPDPGWREWWRMLGDIWHTNLDRAVHRLSRLIATYDFLPS